jgi:hypothetical protein
MKSLENMKRRTFRPRLVRCSFWPAGILLTWLGSVIALAPAWGQPGMSSDQQDKLRALRAVYFTEALSLNETEQSRFLPLLRDHETQVSELHERIRRLETHGAPREGSAADVTSWIAEVERLQRAELALRADFLRASLPIIGPQRVVRIPELQREFRKRMLAEISGTKPGHPPTGGPRRH